MPNCGENYPYDGGTYVPEPWTEEQKEAYRQYRALEKRAFKLLKRTFPKLNLTSSMCYWMLSDYSEFPLGEYCGIENEWVNQVKDRYPRHEASADFFDDLLASRSQNEKDTDKKSK